LNYLKYHEHTAENLQFFLWYQDYVKRFNELPVSERNLAPEWTEALAEAERKEYRQQVKARGPQNPVAKEMFKNSDFEEKAVVPESVDLTSVAEDGISTPSEEYRGITSSESKDRPVSSVTGMKSFISGFSQKADSAFEENGMNRPCTFFRLLVDIPQPNHSQSLFNHIVMRYLAFSQYTLPGVLLVNLTSQAVSAGRSLRHWNTQPIHRPSEK
jgi:hypothetical protein